MDLSGRSHGQAGRARTLGGRAGSVRARGRDAEGRRAAEGAPPGRRLEVGGVAALGTRLRRGAVQKSLRGSLQDLCEIFASTRMHSGGSEDL